MIYRVSSAHEEGGDRVYAVSTEEFVGDDDRRGAGAAADRGGLRAAAGSRRCQARAREIPCDLALLAMGFTGAEQAGPARRPGRRRSTRAATWRASASYETSVPGVFVAGDMGRGQSLIVWAIAEGRSAAAAVDEYLRGLRPPAAPGGHPPTARPLR